VRLLGDVVDPGALNVFGGGFRRQHRQLLENLAGGPFGDLDIDVGLA
jgi:hypothetical protein